MIDLMRQQVAQKIVQLQGHPEVNAFHALWYDNADLTWAATRWLGVPLQKSPLDLFVQQDLIVDLRPSLILETGSVAAARDLRRRGARAAVITLGKQGAAGVDEAGAAFAWAAPQAGGLFPVGSGDSLFGGIAWALERGQPLKEPVKLGVAVGAANTLQAGTAIFTREQVEMMLNETKAKDPSDFGLRQVEVREGKPEGSGLP